MTTNLPELQSKTGSVTIINQFGSEEQLAGTNPINLTNSDKKQKSQQSQNPHIEIIEKLIPLNSYKEDLGLNYSEIGSNIIHYLTETTEKNALSSKQISTYYHFNDLCVQGGQEHLLLYNEAPMFSIFDRLYLIQSTHKNFESEKNFLLEKSATSLTNNNMVRISKNSKARSFNKTKLNNSLDNEEIGLSNKALDSMIYGYSQIFPGQASQGHTNSEIMGSPVNL